MKKIVVSAFGSFGDLHPYVAVALELKKRVHHVVIATSEIYRESLKAARALGVRAVLLVGDERNRPSFCPKASRPSTTRLTPSFCRARAVVHHGGVGTTGQVLRAGASALVMPFSHDQFDNGARRTRRRGPRVPRSKYSAATATRELRALLDDESYTTRAAEIGRRGRFGRSPERMTACCL